MSAWFGRWCWYDLMTPDPAASKRFYGELFGWTVQAHDPRYEMLFAGEDGLGGLATSEGRVPPHWLGYVWVESVDAEAKRIEEAGGRIVHGPAEISPEVGRFAVAMDPQGAAFAIYQSARGFPETEPPKGQVKRGLIAWHELMTTDVDAALRFYGGLFGWKAGERFDMGSSPYQVFEYSGEGMGGIQPAPPGQPPAWLFYVHVEDAAATLAKATSLGATPLYGPVEVPGGGKVAGFVDPQGAAIAIYQTAPGELS